MMNAYSHFHSPVHFRAMRRAAVDLLYTFPFSMSITESRFGGILNFFI